MEDKRKETKTKDAREMLSISSCSHLVAHLSVVVALQTQIFPPVFFICTSTSASNMTRQVV